MAAEFTMPQLGLTMTEGTVVKWLKSVGDRVALGDLLVEVETEKVNYQVESTLEGVLLQILVDEGDVAPVKAPLALIGKKGESPGEAGKRETTGAPAAAAASPPAEAAAAVTITPVAPGERIMASPIARRIAREQNSTWQSSREPGLRGASSSATC